MKFLTRLSTLHIGWTDVYIRICYLLCDILYSIHKKTPLRCSSLVVYFGDDTICFEIWIPFSNADTCETFRLCASKVHSTYRNILLCLLECLTLWNLASHPTYWRELQFQNSAAPQEALIIPFGCTDKENTLPSGNFVYITFLWMVWSVKISFIILLLHTEMLIMWIMPIYILLLSCDKLIYWSVMCSVLGEATKKEN